MGTNLTHPESLKIAKERYVTGNISKNEKLLKKLDTLPGSCVESSRILLEKRRLYERKNIFPESIIDYVANLLRAENDESMNQSLVDLPADDRLEETRRIMQRICTGTKSPSSTDLPLPEGLYSSDSLRKTACHTMRSMCSWI